MQWFAIFFGVYRGRFAPAAPEKLGEEKGQSPSEGVGGLGRTFMAVKIFYFLTQMLKNRGISGILAKSEFYYYLCRKIEEI